MISLSNVIKSSQYVPLDDKKFIEAATWKPPRRSENEQAASADTSSAHQAADLEQAVRDKQLEAAKEAILAEAREEAERIIAQAREEAEQLRKQAADEIAAWREEQEQEAAAKLETISREAWEAAYQEGLEKGEQDGRENWKQSIESAAQVLQDAHAMKKQIISEAEPFLLSLSVEIAESIIGRQLSLKPEWVIEMVQQVLARERRKGVVTLCVSPEQFPFIRESREELEMVLDSQAELQIVPDLSVQGYGCVVRTDFGSLDARIDSQLTEIKQALMQVYASEQGEDQA